MDIKVEYKGPKGEVISTTFKYFEMPPRIGEHVEIDGISRKIVELHHIVGCKIDLAAARLRVVLGKAEK